MSKYHEGGDHNVRHDDTPDELAEKLYDRDYFENNPRGYKNMTFAAKKSQWHDDVIKDFNRALPVRGLTVLDVGCATGVFLRPFFEMGADIYGIDLSEHAASVAATFMAEKLLPDRQRRVVRGSAHDLSVFDDQQFDLYWSVETMEHVPYRYHLAMLREMRRVVKPRGVIYLQGQIGIKDYLNPNPTDDSGHIAVFPEGYWRDMLRHVGFLLVENDADLFHAESLLKETASWTNHNWRFIFARRP